MKNPDVLRVPEEIILINQWDDHSCVLACVAMLTGISRSDVRDLAVEMKMKTPLTNFEFQCLMTECKVLTIRTTDDRLYAGNVYKVCVPSLNTERSLHSIIIDCRDEEFLVYDPQEGNPMREYYHRTDQIPWTSPIIIYDPWNSEQH